MKIVYITNVRIPTPRAQGYAIMKMCEEFAGCGNEVVLYVPNRDDSDKIGDPFNYYKIKNSFELRKVASTDFLSKTLSFGRFFYWIDIFAFLMGLLFKNVASKGDVVYTRDFLVPLFLSKENFICLEVHDIPKIKFLMKYILKKPRMFFVLNQYIKNSLINLGVSESKIHIVPSGVDVKFFDTQLSKSDARKELSLPQDRDIVVYTGHLYKWKGVDTLLGVAKEMKDTFFIFVGGVEPEFTLFKEKSEGLNNILIVPHIERNSVLGYLKASDLLVVPNSNNSKISSEYTSPLKLLEYMASGRPIVASDLPSLREILNTSNSVLAKPDDVGSFVHSIKKVLADSTLGTSISNQAKIDVLPYDWSTRAKKITDLISTNL